MPLCYAMLYYTLQGEIPKLNFLANCLQSNGHNDHMALLDPLKVYKLDTPTTRGHTWYGPNHDHDHSHNHGPGSHNLSSHDPYLKP